MTKTCYLAGPIAGTEPFDTFNWREAAQESLKPIVAISPLRDKEWLKAFPEIPTSVFPTIEPFPPIEPKVRNAIELDDYYLTGKPTAIGARDYYDVSHADMLLAFLPQHLTQNHPSIGTLMEIGWATALRIPVCIVTDDPLIKEHPLIQTHVGWVVPGFDLGIAAVKSVLGVYEGEGSDAASDR